MVKVSRLLKEKELLEKKRELAEEKAKLARDIRKEKERITKANADLRSRRLVLLKKFGKFTGKRTKSFLKGDVALLTGRKIRKK